MSSTTKTVISLVVLIVVILAGWTWYELSQPSQISLPETSQTSSMAPITPTQEPLGSQPDAPVSGLAPASDASDAALDQDMTSVDAQINVLNSDAANLSN